MGITLFDLHFGHIHPIASPPIKKHPELARMPIKLRYEYGMNSLFYNTLPLKNGYKITELYYIIQALFLPAKKAPKPKLICTLFTWQPVRRAFLCVIVMSLN